MKRNMIIFIGLVSMLPLTGCGGGGGGGGGASTLAAKVYLFGNMSTGVKFNNISCIYRISQVTASLTVPNDVTLNYSTARNPSTGRYVTSGVCVSRSLFPTSGLQCVLRDGVIVPSGPVRLLSGDVTGTYDIGSSLMTLTMVNNSGLALKSSTTSNSAKGEEIATINFNLIPGVTPLAISAQDISATVYQERELKTHPQSTVDRQVLLGGSIVNFQ